MIRQPTLLTLIFAFGIGAKFSEAQQDLSVPNLSAIIAQDAANGSTASDFQYYAFQLVETLSQLSDDQLERVFQGPTPDDILGSTGSNSATTAPGSVDTNSTNSLSNTGTQFDPSLTNGGDLPTPEVLPSAVLPPSPPTSGGDDDDDDENDSEEDDDKDDDGDKPVASGSIREEDQNFVSQGIDKLKDLKKKIDDRDDDMQKAEKEHLEMIEKFIEQGGSVAQKHHEKRMETYIDLKENFDSAMSSGRETMDLADEIIEKFDLATDDEWIDEINSLKAKEEQLLAEYEERTERDGKLTIQYYQLYSVATDSEGTKKVAEQQFEAHKTRFETAFELAQLYQDMTDTIYKKAKTLDGYK